LSSLVQWVLRHWRKFAGQRPTFYHCATQPTMYVRARVLSAIAECLVLVVIGGQQRAALRCFKTRSDGSIQTYPNPCKTCQKFRTISRAAVPVQRSFVHSIPACFRRLSARVFCQPLTHLFNLSLSFAFIPPHWKRAWISPVPKITNPKVHADFRPISITPILGRIMERLVVRSYLYPAFISHTSETLTFTDSLPSIPPDPLLLPSSGFSTPLPSCCLSMIRPTLLA